MSTRYRCFALLLAAIFSLPSADVLAQRRFPPPPPPRMPGGGMAPAPRPRPVPSPRVRPETSRTRPRTSGAGRPSTPTTRPREPRKPTAPLRPRAGQAAAAAASGAAVAAAPRVSAADMAIAKNRVAALRQKAVAMRRARALADKTKAEEARAARRATEAAALTAAAAGAHQPSTPEARAATPPRRLGPVLPPEQSRTFTGGTYRNRQATGDEVLYRYHGVDNRTGRTVSYVTNKQYATETELRRDLAILKEWGVKIDRVTTFRPAKGTWMSEGAAARQTGLEGESQPGGGYQAVIGSKELANSTVIRTDKLLPGFYK